jgi:cobalt-precorrin 5A hydrolase
LKIAFFSFTGCGERLKERLSRWLLNTGHEIFELPELSLKEQAAAAFEDADALIFVGAAGIAVRTVAPFVHSKISDPAVIVIDELGKWIVPLLGGHIGGGNELARSVAVFLEAEAIITTATDIHNIFAVDVWASKSNLVISSMEKAKKISASLLKGDKVRLKSDFPIDGIPPAGIVYGGNEQDLGRTGILVSVKRTVSGLAAEDKPLQLIPRRVYAGIGCRKGTGEDEIAAAFDTALESYALDPHSVAGLGSIDLKKTEAGLLAFGEKRSLACVFFDAAQLALAEGSRNASDFVRKTTGVDNVCERAAILASGGGKLLIEKFARNGVTIAAAVAAIELSF